MRAIRLLCIFGEWLRDTGTSRRLLLS